MVCLSVVMADIQHKNITNKQFFGSSVQFSLRKVFMCGVSSVVCVTAVKVLLVYVRVFCGLCSTDTDMDTRHKNY